MGDKAIDLTLSSDDDDDAATNNHGGKGNYTKLGKYATALRKRNTPTSPYKDYDDTTPIIKLEPNVITPQKRMRRANKEAISSTGETSAQAASGSKNPGVGEVGYSFHKYFYVDEKQTRTFSFRGEVIEILDGVKEGEGVGCDDIANIRCKYEGGDVEILSLIELQRHPPCTYGNEDRNEQVARSLKKYGSPKSKPNTCQQESCMDVESSEEDEVSSDDDKSLFGSGDDDEANNECDTANLKSMSSSGDQEGNRLARLQDVHFVCEGNNQSIHNNNDGESSSDDDKSLLGSDDDGYSSDDDKSLFGSEDGNDNVCNQEDKHTSQGGCDEFGSDDDQSLFGSELDSAVADNEFHQSCGQVGDQRISQNYDDDDESRFSDTSFKKLSERAAGRGHKVETTKYIVTAKERVTPAEERIVPEYYYFAHIWGKRMRKVVLPLKLGPPPSILPKSEGAIKYRILYSELHSRGGNGPLTEDASMGPKYYKSFYLGVSGGGLKSMNLRTRLLSIADFESLTYESGAHKTVSRLHLLQSPSCQPPNKSKEINFCFYRLQPENFELIDDQGHLGCGFIHPNFLLELLGTSVGALRVFAIQVRVIGPSSVGIAKGMLFVNDTIDEELIQLPSSMLKVGKSKTKPLHTYVALNIVACFPSKSQHCLGRLLEGDLDCCDSGKDGKRPSVPTDVQALKAPSDCALRVLRCKGVSESDIKNYIKDYIMATSDYEYMGHYNEHSEDYVQHTGHEHKKTRRNKNRKNKFVSIAQAKASIKHGNFVGVSDPTGCIPSGHVFLTGLGDRAPYKVFLTRSPCTEGRDGTVVKVATRRDMPKKSFQFLASIGPGAVVFSRKEPHLPPIINDGDLDGDFYVCIWDEVLLEGISIDAHDEVFGKCDADGIEFKYEINGKFYDSLVLGNLHDDKDLYQVATGPNKKTLITLTMEEILKGRHALSEVVDHRMRKSNGKSKRSFIDLDCKWDSGKRQWLTAEDIEFLFDNPPEALSEYLLSNDLLESEALSQKLRKWVHDSLGLAEVLKITDHRTHDCGQIEVLCQYDDGTEDWLPLEEQKKECKIFIGAYAKEKNLFAQPGWEKTDGYWLKEVQDIMCEYQRSNDISRLISILHRLWKEEFDESGENHRDTTILGRAFKESLDIEKHGGIIKLPLRLHCKLPKKTQKNKNVGIL